MNIKKSIITALVVIIPSIGFSQTKDYLTESFIASIAQSGQTVLAIKYSQEKIDKIKSYIQKSKTDGFNVINLSLPGEDRKTKIAIAHKAPINLLLLAKEIELVKDDAIILSINFDDGVAPDLAALSDYKFACWFHDFYSIKKAVELRQSIGAVIQIGTGVVNHEHDGSGTFKYNPTSGIITNTHIGTLLRYEPHSDIKGYCMEMEKVNLDD
jgi:hypothetical protein